MVVCLIALVVFGILGIFSATHRLIAKEAFECVFLRVTLRPCTSGLDKRLKSQITGKLLRRSPRTGKFVFKHFEIISWIFTIIMILSIAYSAMGIYSYAVYGSCEPHSTTCVFNPGELSCGSQHCADEGCDCDSRCDAPTFDACGGSCDCKEQICG